MPWEFDGVVINGTREINKRIIMPSSGRYPLRLLCSVPLSSAHLGHGMPQSPPSGSQKLALQYVLFGFMSTVGLAVVGVMDGLRVKEGDNEYVGGPE
jgi:hypothetical protein